MRSRPTTPPNRPTSSGSTDAPPKNPGAPAPGPTSSIEVTVLYELAKWVDSVRPVVVGAVAATAVKKPVPQVIHCGYCGGRLDSRVCVECGERLLT